MLHETVACPSPGTALTPVGASGTVGSGMTEGDGSDGGPFPMLFVAVTVNVYGCPLVSMITVADVAPAVCAVLTPSDAITKYWVIGLPPSGAGAQVTVAWPLPGVATTFVGAPGAVAAGCGVTDDEGADAAPVPTLLVAVTVNV